MGNGYNHHHHHLHKQSFYNNNIYLPLLCRVSIKDARARDYRDCPEDPSSPRVSCMGQVRRNSRFIGFSTPYRLTTAPATGGATSTATAAAVIASKAHLNNPGSHFRYTKLKRLFSGKSLLPAAAAPAGRSRSCKEMTVMRRNGSRRSSKINNDEDSGDPGCRHTFNNNDLVDLNVDELDPPLPVIKKVQPESEVNLWKRRSGGLALRNLQIEQIHAQKNVYNYPPAPTV